MTEKRYKYKSYLIKLFCDECGEEMCATGKARLSYPGQYEYCCIGDAKHSAFSTKKYPYEQRVIPAEEE